MARGSRGGKWADYGGGYTPQAVAGGAPAWVPANAKIHIDFLGGTPQGRAWMAGTGEVAVNTLIGDDPNTDNHFFSGNYDPTFSNLEPPGYGGTNAPNPAFLGPLRTACLAAFTLRVQFYMDPLGSGNPAIYLMDVAGDDAIETVLRITSDRRAYIDSYQGSLSAVVLNIVNITVGAINAVAFTIAGSRAEIAANGSPAATGIIAGDDRPAGNPFMSVAIDHRGQRIQSITLYDPLPSTAGLAELSQVT